MARIAITGSTGFVGSNIAEALLALGHSVSGLTRDAAAHSAPWPLIDVDYFSDDSISRALDGVDAVVHCAIANDFNRLVIDRVAAFENYVVLTERIARIADSRGHKFIFISTDWVMDGSGHREPESNPGNAINFYGYLKALAEQAVRSSLEGRGVVARIAGVMGRHRIAESPVCKTSVSAISSTHSFEPFARETNSLCGVGQTSTRSRRRRSRPRSARKSVESSSATRREPFTSLGIPRLRGWNSRLRLATFSNSRERSSRKVNRLRANCSPPPSRSTRVLETSTPSPSSDLGHNHSTTY